MKETKSKAYINLTENELLKFDEQIKKVGFTSRSDYCTACAHVLIYGSSPEEWNKKLYEICCGIDRQQQTFFEILDKRALGIIAMKGIGAVYARLLDDIKFEMLEECGMIPENNEIRDWLKIYKNMRRAELTEYRTEQFKNLLGENKNDNN